MSAATTVHISQRDLDPRTNAIRGLTITARYGDGIETQATILLRPGGVPNDDSSIGQEIERLGVALIAATRSSSRITG